jgi:hypothetical protein
MHHCMGAMLADPGSDLSSAKAFSSAISKCPRYPVAAPAPRPYSVVPDGAHTTGMAIFVRPASLPQTEARYRVSYSRSRQKRGPPVILL